VTLSTCCGERTLIWRYVEDRDLLGDEARARSSLLYWNSDQDQTCRARCMSPACAASTSRTRSRPAASTEAEGAKVSLQSGGNSQLLHPRRPQGSPSSPLRLGLRQGVKLFPGDVTFVLADSGHIAGVVEPARRQQVSLPGSPTSCRPRAMAGCALMRKSIPAPGGHSGPAGSNPGPAIKSRRHAPRRPHRRQPGGYVRRNAGLRSATSAGCRSAAAAGEP